MDEVGELDLGDRDQPVQGRSDRDPDDRRLGQRCVEHPRLAKAFVQAIGRSKDAALAPDVFAEHEDSLVALHLLGDGRTHRLDHPHAGHHNRLSRGLERCGSMATGAVHIAR